MARRKTPRAARRSRPPKRGGARPSRARSAAGPRKKSTARKARPARARKSARLRGASPKQTRVRKATASRVQRKTRKTSPQTRAKKSSVRLASKAAKKASAGAARKRAGARPAPTRTPFVARKAPSLDRERRIVRDDDVVPTPPSSLDLDRSASAARSGRRELHERFKEHTETSPAITGGDIDADWESAYTVGDEAPGGDNPTPDQDIVDDIGKAVGVQYEDNEELKGETKIKERDRKRWELDPASSEDYNDR